jgi:hypothetical protein
LVVENTLPRVAEPFCTGEKCITLLVNCFSSVRHSINGRRTGSKTGPRHIAEWSFPSDEWELLTLLTEQALGRWLHRSAPVHEHEKLLSGVTGKTLPLLQSVDSGPLLPEKLLPSGQGASGFTRAKLAIVYRHHSRISSDAQFDSTGFAQSPVGGDAEMPPPAPGGLTSARPSGFQSQACSKGSRALQVSCASDANRYFRPITLRWSQKPIGRPIVPLQRTNIPWADHRWPLSIEYHGATIFLTLYSLCLAQFNWS